MADKNTKANESKVEEQLKEQLQAEIAAKAKAEDQLKEQLQAEIAAKAEVEKQNNALQTEITELKEKVDADTSTTAARFDVLEKELVGKNQQIEDLSVMVSKLSKEAGTAKATTSTLPGPVVVEGLGRYEFRLPGVIFEGKKYTASEVAEDEELVLALIEAGAGILVKAD